MLFIQVVKWLFIVGALWFSFHLYNSENRKLRTISKHIKDQDVMKNISSSARRRMLHLLIIFTTFIVWMISYDFLVQDVNTRNQELSEELRKTSQIYENLTDSQIRLLATSTKSETAQDIAEFYRSVLVNYYVMKKCNLEGQDDIFIINSAMTREMWLNNVSLNLREEIIKSAKQSFNETFSEFECSDLHGRNNEIQRNYENYIITTREVLKGIF